MISFNVPLAEIQDYVLKELRKIGIEPPITDIFEPGLARSSILEKLRQYATSRGGRFLSDKYLGSDKKHLWQCQNPEHPPFTSSPTTVRTGRWCDKCVDENWSESYKLSVGELQELAQRCTGELVLDASETASDSRFSSSDKAQFHCLLCHRRPIRTVRQIKEGRLCSCATKKNRIDRFVIEDKLVKNSIHLVGIRPEVTSLPGRTRVTLKCIKCGEHQLSKISLIQNGVIKCKKCSPSRNAGITIEKARECGERVNFLLLSDELMNGKTVLSWECRKCGVHLDKPFRDMRNVRRCRNCEQIQIAARWKIV